MEAEAKKRQSKGKKIDLVEKIPQGEIGKSRDQAAKITGQMQVLKKH